MTSCESSLRPVGPRRKWVLFGMVFALLAGGFLSWRGFDQQAVSWVVQRRVDPDSHFWVEAFTLLGKAWLQIWLLLVWFLVCGRRRDVLAGILALAIIAITVSPLKVAVGRVRPYTIVKAQEPGHAEHHTRVHLSFPSGDTAAAFAVAGAITPTLGGLVRVALLSAGVLVGGLRVTALAHYPSDVLVGAAIGLLAGWLATRLIDKWGRADRAMPCEEWLVWGGIIALPVSMGISEGADDLLLFLKTYGVLVACIFFTIGFRDYWRRTAREVLVSLLATNRHIIVSLAIVGVVIENVLNHKRPHELLPFDESLSPNAALGAALVVVGVLMRHVSASHTDRPLESSNRLVALNVHWTLVAPFLVVCGLLMQLSDWTNWLVVLPLFFLSYGASLVRQELSGQTAASRLRPREGGRIYWPATVSSLYGMVQSQLRGLWRPSISADAGRTWTSLALACLPLVLELFVEDFICEALLHIH